MSLLFIKSSGDLSFVHLHLPSLPSLCRDYLTSCFAFYLQCKLTSEGSDRTQTLGLVEPYRVRQGRSVQWVFMKKKKLSLPGLYMAVISASEGRELIPFNVFKNISTPTQSRMTGTAAPTLLISTQTLWELISPLISACTFLFLISKQQIMLSYN